MDYLDVVEAPIGESIQRPGLRTSFLDHPLNLREIGKTVLGVVFCSSSKSHDVGGSELTLRRQIGVSKSSSQVQSLSKDLEETSLLLLLC